MSGVHALSSLDSAVQADFSCVFMGLDTCGQGSLAAVAGLREQSRCLFLSEVFSLGEGSA